MSNNNYAGPAAAMTLQHAQQINAYINDLMADDTSEAAAVADALAAAVVALVNVTDELRVLRWADPWATPATGRHRHRA